jgi:small conductance mechanosensitive channel
MKRYIRYFSLFVFLGIWLSASGSAVAQSAQPAASGGMSAIHEAELKSLVQTLKNDEERKKLISQLEVLLDAKSKASPEKKAQFSIGTRAIEFLSGRLQQFSGEIVAGTRTILDLPNVYDWIVGQASDPGLRARWIEIAWKVLLAIGAGLVLEFMVRLILARPRSVLEAKDIDGLWVQLSTLSLRTALDFIPILGFVAGSYAALLAIKPGTVTQDVIVALIIANVVVRLVMAGSRMILAPVAGSLRLVPLKDVDANYLFIWVRRVADVAIYGYALVHVALLLGLPQSGGDILLKIIGLFVALLLIIFVLQNRVVTGDWLRGINGTAGSLLLLRGRLADIWHVPTILYIMGMYAVWALSIADGFRILLQATVLTIVILIAARIAFAIITSASRRVFALNPDVKLRYPGLEARANRYQPIFERATSAVLGIVAIFSVLEAWGVNSFEWLGTPFGQRATGSLITIALLLVMTVVIWELTSAMVERYLSKGDEAVSARARTLLPLLRTTILVILITILVMVSLSELGVNIGPLLAGAGVIGLAIGFGAQTLVKDIITGLFILVEDHISVGDVVQVGTHAGVVEKLTLRTIQLRDVAGTVHVVPFSAVTTLENMTKDFSRYVFNVGIAYREDTDHVISVLHELGEELIQDENFKDLILQPLEVLGVDSFGDNAVVIKARITTKPIKQWMVGREFNRRMKKRFDELGIEIPFPHRTIYFGEDQSGKAPPARIATVDNEAHLLEQQNKLEQQGKVSARKRTTTTPTPETVGSGTPDGD